MMLTASFFSRTNGITGVVLPFFLIWIITTVALFYLPVPPDITSFQHHLVVLFVIFIYLVLASSLAGRMISAVFQEIKKRIVLFSALSLALIVILYWYMQYFAYSKIAVAAISTANLLFLTSIIGAALSSAVTRLGELVPLCITAACADLISVMQGPTSDIIETISTYYAEGMEGPPPPVDSIIIKAGIPGYSIPMPLFGAADWIFIILLSSALLRLGKRDNLFAERINSETFLKFPVATAALLLALIYAQITTSYVPAMVFISAVFLLFLFAKLKVYRELTKKDIIYSIVFPALVTTCILVFYS